MSATDGLTILALGGAVGYLMTQKKNAESLVQKSISAYRAEDKPPANKPTPAAIRHVQESYSKDCPVEDVNMEVSANRQQLMKEARRDLQEQAISYDENSGSLNEPPPPTIQGVYLTFGA